MRVTDKAKTPQRVEVVWMDATYNSGTFTREEVAQRGLVELQLLGWLVRETKEVVITSSEYNPVQDRFSGIHVTPRNSIIRITSLRRAGGARAKKGRKGGEK